MTLSPERRRVLEMMKRRGGGLLAPFFSPVCFALGGQEGGCITITHEEAGELEEAGLIRYSHTISEDATVSVLSPAALELLAQ